MMNRNIDVFMPDRKYDFPFVLNEIQQEMSTKHAALMSQNNKQPILQQLRQCLTERRFSVKGFTTDSLAERLYQEMKEWSFLTPYLNMEIHGVEEVNINSWYDTKVHFSDGRVEPVIGSFYSAEHALNVIRRLLSASDITLDNASPCVRGYLSNNIRITVNGPGVIDKEKGVAASIRFVNPEKMQKEDFINKGTATEEILDFISLMFRYGLSVCYAGATGTGKTTLMSWALSTLPNEKRIYTIENGTREFDLEKKDKLGKVLNNVIHTVTRYSKDPAQNITQRILLEQGLTFDPDYMGMAEIKGDEAYDAQEAARTGHPVVATVHTNSAAGIPSRIVSLCKERCNLDDKTLYSFVTEAFPIGLYIKRNDDYVRRIVSVCEFTPDETRPLYRFRTDNNRIENGHVVVTGKFEKVNNISENLQQRLRDNGIPEDVLQRFL